MFALLADGLSIKEIANNFRTGTKRVESHKYNIMEKRGAGFLSDLTKIAIKKKLTGP